MPDRKWILLVEDNPDDEELTRRAIKKNNPERAARETGEGIEYFVSLFLRAKPLRI